MDLVKVERFVERHANNLNTIIVNGGDPLMMSPQYYWDLIAILEKYECDAKISLTSNLWAFHKKPQMWTELFRHPQIGVITSFQYGNKRLKGDNTPFTEKEFWAISNQFLALVGYRPEFIAVIDQDNRDTVLQTVQLAKAMGVECKINHVLASGPQIVKQGVTMGSANNFFTQADMYAHYIEIIEAGLADWEYNCKQLSKKLRGAHTTCPLSRRCDSGIRTLQPDGSYYSCGAFGDDRTHRIDFEQEMASQTLQTPLQDDPDLDTMKMACYGCPMFEICNGCRKTIQDTKKFGLQEHQCRTMKSLAPKIIEINGLTGVLEPTPYEDESGIIAKG